MGQHWPLIIVGLDGGTFDLLDPMFARGELPTLRRLSETGLRTELLSTLPVATLPAWTSFMTAANPAQHGVIDIFVRRRDSYGLVPANGTLRTAPTFMRRLSATGARVASLGVPGTYPPESLNGLCIAGFDAPGVRRASRAGITPASVWRDVEALGGWRYATFNEHRVGAARLEHAVRALMNDIDVKERVIRALYAREAWDVFFIHLQASDTAGHHLWHTYDARSPRHRPPVSDALPRVYRRLDALVGHLLAQARPNTRVLVVSDHGIGGASATAVHLNRLLHTHEMLRFAPPRARRARTWGGVALRRMIGALPAAVFGNAIRLAPQKLVSSMMDAARGTVVNWAESDAFSDELDYAPSIWINAAGTFPHGRVHPKDVAPLTERIRDAVLSLRHATSGAQLVSAVHRRRDLPAGPHQGAMPDLLVEPAWPDGYRPSFLVSHGPGPVVRDMAPHELAAPKGRGMPGVHTRAGVFIASGPGIPAMLVPTLHIAEAGSLVYPLTGRPMPTDLSVRAPEWLFHLLDDAAHEATQAATAAAVEPYTAAQSAELTRHLQALGYLDS